MIENRRLKMYYIMMNRASGDCVVTTDPRDWPGYHVADTCSGTKEEAMKKSLPYVEEANRIEQARWQIKNGSPNPIDRVHYRGF
jgi:hypothetical protein